MATPSVVNLLMGWLSSTDKSHHLHSYRGLMREAGHQASKSLAAMQGSCQFVVPQKLFNQLPAGTVVHVTTGGTAALCHFR